MLTGRRALVLIVGLLLALAWAVPSLGASAGKVARLALSRANQAFHNANLAISNSDAAKKTANSASATASSASSAANAAQSTASAAQSTANQALSQANSIVPGGRGFARVDGSGCAPSTACAVDHARAVIGARETATAGQYCVTASGLSPSSATWVASVDAGDTTNPGETQAMPATGSGCNSGEFQVRTTRSGNAAGDVSFFVVIP